MHPSELIGMNYLTSTPDMQFPLQFAPNLNLLQLSNMQQQITMNQNITGSSFTTFPSTQISSPLYMSSNSTSDDSEETQQIKIIDERRQRRMISNRESARRSRLRKQQHMDELMKEANDLKLQNSELSMKIDAVSNLYVGIESENNVLRAQMMELTDRLRSLNSVLQFMQDASGLAMDIPEIPENLLEPWRIPCGGLQAVSNVFQC